MIDDERLARFTMKEILESACHEVKEAPNGVEGIALQKSQPFDLVLTDIVMPEKEGAQTIIDLRRDVPTLPIIAASGGGWTRNLYFLMFAERLGRQNPARNIRSGSFAAEAAFDRRVRFSHFAPGTGPSLHDPLQKLAQRSDSSQIYEVQETITAHLPIAKKPQD